MTETTYRSGSLPRPSIMTPDGRVFYGRWPQSMTATTGEAPYILALAEHVHGVCEVVLPAGRARRCHQH